VVGWIDYEGRQYPRAIQECGKTFEMDPNYVPALLDLGSVYLRTGEYDKAIAQFERAKNVVEHKGVALSHLAQAHAMSGDKSEAGKILLALQEPWGPKFASAWDFAQIHIALGEKTKALEFLEKAADQHFAWVVILAVDPAFDPLRAEPRFKALVQRVAIPVSNGCLPRTIYEPTAFQIDSSAGSQVRYRGLCGIEQREPRKPGPSAESGVCGCSARLCAWRWRFGVPRLAHRKRCKPLLRKLRRKPSLITLRDKTRH
jgi:hypothetical protein